MDARTRPPGAFVMARFLILPALGLLVAPTLAGGPPAGTAADATPES